jgi:patatin-like phospholipase/acyl hydrolase
MLTRVVGVSAGSIVALALANGVSPKDTVKFFEDDVKQVFEEGVYARMKSLDNAFGACYRTDAMRGMLEHTLGTKTLAGMSLEPL